MARLWQAPSDLAGDTNQAVNAEMRYLQRLAYAKNVHCANAADDFRAREINESIDRLRFQLRYLVYGISGSQQRLDTVVNKLESLEAFMNQRPGKHSQMIALQVRAIIWFLCDNLDNAAKPTLH